LQSRLSSVSSLFTGMDNVIQVLCGIVHLRLSSFITNRLEM
jgi:hypothetical protein